MQTGCRQDAADADVKCWRMKTEDKSRNKKDPPGPEAAAPCWKEHAAQDSKSDSSDGKSECCSGKSERRHCKSCNRDCNSESCNRNSESSNNNRKYKEEVKKKGNEKGCTY